MRYLLNLIKHQQPDIDKTYLNIKHSFESYHQLLIKEKENVGINPLRTTSFLQ